MATGRYYGCKCGQRRCVSPLFDALRSFQETQTCKACGRAKELHLVFPFGLGLGKTRCRILDVFLPRRLETWRDRRDGKKVTFFPFLVILKREHRKQACWLPYWHLKKGRKKYGQWAPFMDEPLFRDLLAQAHRAGYLRDRTARDQRRLVG
jgi:hypothetical protein